MRYYFSSLLSFALIVLSFAAVSILSNSQATAATSQLTWADNSSNETGFRVERKIGIAGTFSVIATAGANATSYSDSTLANSTTYCYRVNAFNAAGNSPYSPEVCGTTPAATTTPPPQQFTLTVAIVKTVTNSGTGNGTVTSSPAGINCGSVCSASFNSGTLVTLTATPAAGSTFAGWSGTGCNTGVVTMNIARSCTATFNPQPVQPLILSVIKSGTGSGTVTSNPAGINCGSVCSASFNSGTLVTLKATPATDSRFTGWSGNGCSAGIVTMNASITCTATFQSTSKLNAKLGVFRPDTGEWYLDLNGDGQWDGCTQDRCLGAFGVEGALPVTGDWGDTGTVRIGVFEPSTAKWYLDMNGNGKWDGCTQDRCLGAFGVEGALPVTGDWDGTGTVRIGVFEPSTAKWYLDMNGNGKWDGCTQDRCFGAFGVEGALPVTGDWDGTGTVRIGVFEPSTAKWYLDMNGNGKWDGCTVDACLGPFGQAGDLPVVGGW